MATVLVKAYATNPALLFPNLYSSCFWNFVTGWQCETVEPAAPPSGGGSAPPNASGGGPVVSLSAPPNSQSASGMKNCGCCGGASAPSTALTQIATAAGASAASVTTAGGKPCGCGGKCGQPDWLGALAAIVLAVMALAALSSD